MSKRKKEEPGAGAFRNTPFRELKKFTPREGPSAPAKQRPPAPAIQQEGDDEDLFLRAIAGARPVVHGERDEENTSSLVRKTGKPRERGDVEASGGELFLQAMQNLGTAEFRPEPDDDEGTGSREPRSASGRMRQLKKGVLRISGELDLHGCLRDEALHRLAHFIANAAARGQQAVLVITGKGNNSMDGPVLKGAEADWLSGPGAAPVAEFHPAPRDKGGSGAYVVFLRRK
ncbi:MAG: Smr/MutS family protein [Nitrospirota bacterium]|nr:Smr/MutS family protein [Nitrospirota bacterium]